MRFSNPPVAARSRARRMALVVAAALCIGAMPVDALGQGWYDSNWSYRKKITIDNTMVAGNLTNFPVLLDFTDTDLRDKARNDGFDILFTADDGTTKLDHDIESYTGSSGALVVWVEVTSLSGSVDTDIYMYYGYASATNQEAEAATWSDSYVAVYHLHDDFNDASGNQGAATNSGSADVSGIAGDGQNFVKSQGDYIDTNWAPSSFTGDYTFEGWFRALGQTGSGDLIGVEDRGTGDDSEVRLAIRDRDSNGSADGYDVELRADGGDIISSDGALPGDPDDGSWHHLAIVREGTSGRVYYDGVWITLPDSATSSGTASFPSPRTILLGAQWNTDAGGPPATRNRINADLDELRIHTKMRTQPFFATQVANVNNSSPGGFYDLPDPEENPPVGGTVLLIVGNGSIPDQADQDLKSYLEGRGLTVYYADDTDGTASFQQDIDTLGVDVVYVSQTVSSSNLSPTKPLTAGVVMANSGNWKDEALVAHDNEDVATTIQIVDNSHFITQEYSLGSVTIYSSSGARGFGDMGFGPDAQILATTGTSGEATLVVYEQGGELEDGSFAVNRRVGIWEEEPNFDIYTADNLNMVYRALLWGGSLDAGGSGGTNAVTSATAEISPNDVQTNSAGVEFVYAILATIGGTDTGVDSVEIAVPASFGLPTLDSVRVSGTLATITDNTSGRTISFNLSTKLTSTDSIQAYFTADAPTSSDATGQIFPSTVDDKSTPELPQGTIEGSADGDAGDANSWRVTTSGAVSSATAEISPNEVMTRSTGVQFIYAILATIGGDDSGVDEVEITVPTEFGLPTVDSVRVGGTAVTYTDNTGGTRTISLVLDTKLTSTDSIQVYFTSDAPSATDATGKNFTSTIDDTGDSWTATATTEGSADGDGADANDWTVTTSGAVTSATAEISPNDVYTSTTGNEYIYAILATISGDDSGVDRVEITVPATHGLPTVDSVRVGGTVVTYTDNTGGTRTISLDLTAKVTATDSIQVYFTADAPTTADGGVNFTSTVDDTGDSWSATSTTEGSADGDASDSNSWTVTTTDSPATLLVRYWIDEAPSGQSITELIDDAASPLNMPLTYVSSSPTWEGDNGGQRNLRFYATTDGDDTGGGQVAVNGTKIDNIHLASQVTLEVKYMLDPGSCSGQDARIFGIADGSGSGNGQLVMRTVAGPSGDVLAVQWSGVGLARYALESGCPITSGSVVHWVIDTSESTAADRVRAYIDGSPATVNVWSGSLPNLNDTINLGSGTRRMSVGRPYDGNRTFRGRVWYAAVYEGAMTAGQVSSNASAINAADDNNTYAVTVTPDATPVTREAGSYSYAFTLNNGSSVSEDFDLLASTSPVSSFITIDSISGGGIATSGVADSARITGVVAAADSTVNVWYTVAVTTDGRVDTLFLRGRSISDPAVLDTGSVYIQFDAGGNAVDSARAEISPNNVATNSTGNSFLYAILPFIGAGTGVDSLTITVPATYGDPTVTDVQIGGTTVGYTDNTAGKLISINLDTKLVATDSIIIFFNADAPTSADAGVNFTSTVDDTSSPAVAEATIEGSADGDAGDANSWTVTTTDSGGGGGPGGFCPAVDTVSTGTTQTDTIRFQHTTSSDDNRLMLVGVSIDNDNLETVDYITYNGVALNFVGARNNAPGGGDDARVEIWSLVAPDPGTHDVVIVFTADLLWSAVAGAITFIGVDQDSAHSPFYGNDDDGPLSSVTVNSAEGEMVFALMSGEWTGVPTLQNSPPAIERWNLLEPTSPPEHGAAATDSGAAPNVTISWSHGADHWAAGGVSILPAAACLTGTPSISSAANQLFLVGDPTTAAAQITIADDASSPTITDANNLRIRIPAGLDMIWDTLQTALVLGGNASTKVSATVFAYEDAGKTVVLDVISSFAAADTITVDSLKFMDFGSISAADSLELEVYNDGLVSAVDDKTKEILATAVTSAAAEISPNDVGTSSIGVEFIYAILATIGGSDTGVDSIEITVPATFGDPAVDSVRVGGAAVTYTDNTAAKLISITLDSKVTSSDSIQVYFTADAPTASDTTGVDFTSTVDDKGTIVVPQSTTEGNGDGDAADNNSWTVTTSGAVSSAAAEISPNNVLTSATGVEFVYAILATISGDDSGVDSLEITVPATFGDPVVDSVRVGGAAVTYTDNTSGKLISITLDTKLTSTDSIQVYFTADAPTSPDAVGQIFYSKVDDTGTTTPAQGAVMGNGDGDAGDNNSWNVTTGDPTPAVTSATAEIWPNDVTTGWIGVEFIYAILATISGGETGVDRVQIDVPSTFGLPTVDSVRVGGTAVTYTDNTGGTRTISVDLTTKVTTTDSIQVYFTSDAPALADPGGKNFTSSVDDSGTGSPAQSTTEGSADGDATDANDWTVTTTDQSGGGGTPGGVCPAVDTVFTGTVISDSLLFQHTTSSGPHRLMLVGVSINNDGDEVVSWITYNGDPLSRVVSEQNLDDARVEIWQLVNPDPGTNDVVVKFSADLMRSAVVGAITFTGADQTPIASGDSAFADGSTSSVTVNSAIGELVFAMMSGETTGRPNLQNSPPAAEQWSDSVTSVTPEEYGAAATVDGASPNVTVSWTHANDHWATGGVSIAPASACLNAAPTISSNANQSFGVGDPATLAERIVITEDPSYMTITSPNDVRITIPAGLDMIWDTTLTTVTIGGASAGKVSGTLLPFEDNGKTAVINITSDFAGGDQFYIDSLKFMDFGSISAADSLELEVYNDGLVSAVDDKTKEITVASDPAVTSATAEISPNDVVTSSSANAFIYAILATIGGSDTGVDSIEITVPTTFGDPVVDSVRVGGTAVTYTDFTAAKLISITLDTKVTSSDSIQVYFTADAPTTADAGVDFTSTVDDKGTAYAAQATTEGNADGDAADNNSWTVTTADAPATLLGRYWFNEAPSGQTPTTVYDDQASPVNLTMTYDTGVEWTVTNEHRGLNGATGPHAGAADADATSTKYQTNLDGATQASFVVVAEWTNSGAGQAIAGFYTAGGARVAHFGTLSNGTLDIWFRTAAQTDLRVTWGGTGFADGTRRVFHVVYDSDDPTAANRVRLYVNGADQGTGTLTSGSWPASGEALDFSGSIAVSGLNEATAHEDGAQGTLFYYAIYDGEMTDSEISTDYTALNADDDNITPAVSVTPDGAGPVVEQPGTENSYDFVVENTSSILEDYDLLASTNPVSSFVTVDSITFNGLSFTSPPDSARLVGLAAGVSDTVTVWYTVASDTDGNVDSLYVTGRSVTDNSVTDDGFVEIEFDEPPLTPLVRYWIDEAPSGQGVTQLLDAESNPLNMPISYPTSSPVWVGSMDGGGNRHLRFSGSGDTGGGVVDIGGTKVDAVHGATSITLEVKYMMDGGGTCSNEGERIFGISDGDSSPDGWLAVRERGGRDVLQVQWQGQSLGIYGFGSGCPITSGSVVHWVIDTNNATQADRVRAYVDGVRQTVSALESSSFPSQGETIDLGPGTRRMFVGRPHTGFRTFNGRIWFAALYQGVMSDAQITSNAASINGADDQYSYAVTMTPDGSAVVRQAGSFSYDFNLNNGSNVAEDFDLLASVGPASSFITVDSITGGGVSASAVADSTQITGVTVSADSTVTVWYTVASSTDGRIDTLYLSGRSVSDTSQSDLAWIEIEFEAVSFAVTPDGADTLQLLPSGSNGPSSYKFTITNNSAVSETFDLLATPGDGSSFVSVDSLVGPNLTGGSPGDSARTGSIAAAASDSAFVWFSVAVSAPGALDSLYLMGRSVSQPTATDSGWVFIELLRPNVTITHAVNPNGTQPPGTDLTYTVTITNSGNYDATNVVAIDSLGAEIEFKVGSEVENMPGTVTVAFSDDNGGSWTYTPTPGGCSAAAGYDDCVTHIRWTLDADLSYIGPNNTGTVEYVARIK